MGDIIELYERIKELEERMTSLESTLYDSDNEEEENKEEDSEEYSEEDFLKEL